MTCPDCKETLVMSDRNGVEIDYCPKCRGVWLDRGELDKIIERSQNPSQNSQRDHSDRRSHDDDYKYRKNKKDSFLGDLFDF
jgi:Zn-finger nucleic acid-binding protein